MYKSFLKIRNWWAFAAAAAASFLFFLFAPAKPSDKVAPPIENAEKALLKKIFPQLPAPNPPVINKVASEPAKFTRRMPSAQTPPAPERLLPHALLNPTPWKIWLNTQAIRGEDQQNSDVVLAQVSRMLIIESGAENANLTEFNSASPIVVYDARLKKTGFINGMIRVQTMSKPQLEADLIELNAHITDSFEAINTYFVTGLDPIFDLESLYSVLKAKPYVKSADLDITSRTYEKF